MANVAISNLRKIDVTQSLEELMTKAVNITLSAQRISKM